MSEIDPTGNFNRLGRYDDLKHGHTVEQRQRILAVISFDTAASERMTKVFEKNYPAWVQKEIARVWKERDQPAARFLTPDRDRSKTAASIEREAHRRVQHRQQRRSDRLMQWRQKEIENPRQVMRPGPEQSRQHRPEPVREPPAPLPEKQPVVSEWRRTAELRKAAHAERSASRGKEGGRER
jgi:hypothetical protein